MAYNIESRNGVPSALWESIWHQSVREYELICMLSSAKMQLIKRIQLLYYHDLLQWTTIFRNAGQVYCFERRMSPVVNFKYEKRFAQFFENHLQLDDQ